MTTATDQRTADARVQQLCQIRAKWRGISVEPLLGPITLRHHFEAWKIDFVIVGGESGAEARPMNPRWVLTLRDECEAAGVPFFFKQWGCWIPAGQEPALELPPKCRGQHVDGTLMLRAASVKTGANLDGREWREFPAIGGAVLA